MTIKTIVQSICAASLIVLFAGSAQAMLLNGTFETPDASGGDIFGAPNWTPFDNVWTNSNLGPGNGPVSHDAGGSQSLKMWGFTSGVFQDVNSVIPGQEYQLEAWAMNWALDPFSALGILQLQFWDGLNGTGSQIGANIDAFVFPFIPSPPKPLHYDLSVVQDGAEISDWTRIALSGIAPAGTMSARVYLLHIDDVGRGGSIRWDDVSLKAVSVPVPATLALFGLGLAGLGWSRRKKV